MSARISFSADSRTQTRHARVFPALKEREHHKSNIWIFDSPKNGSRFVIKGDVAFMHFVLLEGDVSVQRYLPEPPPVTASVDGEVRQTQLDAEVHFVNGEIEWWEFKRVRDTGPGRSGRAAPQLSAQAQAASAAGVKYRVLTETELFGQEVLFDNWLMLCAAMSRCSEQTINRETDYLLRRLSVQESISFGTLLGDEEWDPAHVLAAVAKLLQHGVIQADLERALFGLHTVLTRRTI